MPYFDAFRFPKMMFDKNINLHYAAKETLKPCLAGMARMYVIPAVASLVRPVNLFGHPRYCSRVKVGGYGVEKKSLRQPKGCVH
eukprot:1156379-Pelagomonas_calceolata.AAC.3